MSTGPTSPHGGDRLLHLPILSRHEEEDETIDPLLAEAIAATQRLREQQDAYSVIRNARERATFAMMMKMDPESLTAIRKEFFARRDEVVLKEFIYIIQKHLGTRRPTGNMNTSATTGSYNTASSFNNTDGVVAEWNEGNNNNNADMFVMVEQEQREFGINMYELFKDIDVNGDGNLEWQEFTSFTVEKANLLNKRAKLASIAHYHDSSANLDQSAKNRHRHDISRLVNIPNSRNFAMVEDHKNAVFVFNSRHGKHIATIPTESAPIAIECVVDRDREFLVTSGADMTLSTYSLDDPNPKRRYKPLSSWATPTVQMTLAYSNDSRCLYSGGTDGKIYSWNIAKRSMMTVLPAHNDIIMDLIVLQKLNNIATASLDKSVGIFDSYTNEEILRLYGHRKGVFDLSYSPDYRLIFSCGFEHDACVWSPFVKSLVYRLKGHHASLVGVQTVPNTPEIITADTSGVFKLWDIRTFQCVQTFCANLNGQDTKDSSKLMSFLHCKVPSNNVLQKEDDSRIFAASKMLFSFDQARVVHEATTDYSNVHWMAWNPENSVIITASEQNVIVWDALIGSKMFTHTNIVDEEISAACLDDRRRKVLLGNVKGQIGVYNSSNGALMKTVYHSNPSVVVGMEYVDESKRFVAAYADGAICIYNENDLEECPMLRSFEPLRLETSAMKYSPLFNTILTMHSNAGVARMWDFSSGKCEIEVRAGGPNTTVVVVAFLDPYPIVVTADADGNIIFWGMRGGQCQGIRLAGFTNLTPLECEQEPMPRKKLTDDGSEDRPLRTVHPSAITTCPHTFTNPETPSSPIRSSSNTDNPSSPLRRTHDTMISIASSARGQENHRPVYHRLPAFRLRGLRNNITLDSVKFNPALKDSTDAEVRALIKKCEAKWGKVAAPQTIAFHADTRRLFVGDELGTMRCFDISDFLDDLGGEALATMKSPTKFAGICRTTPRDSHSALPPRVNEVTGDDYETACSLYLLAQPGNSMSYFGVRFLWELPAHEDRIISCTLLGPDHGVMTSAADRLVKLWSFDGILLGTLLQSVPVGTRSISWNLQLDVDAIQEEENRALDEIIEEAKLVAADPDKPDINAMDFSGMALGAESADFSRSALRQRIEKSSQILGLNFPSSNPHRSPFPMSTGLNKGFLSDDASVSTDYTADSKSLCDALEETKSTAPSIDYDARNKQLSYVQRKRKATRMVQMSRGYSEKTGVAFIPPSAAALTNTPATGTMDISGTVDAFQPPVLTGQSNQHEHELNVQLSVLTGDITHGDSTIDSSVDDSTIGSISHIDNRGSMMHSQSMHSLDRRGTLQQKLALSIKEAQEKGPRTQAMIKACRKFSTFDSLEAALSRVSMSPSDSRHSGISSNLAGSGFPMRHSRRRESRLTTTSTQYEDSTVDDSTIAPLELTDEQRRAMREAREKRLGLSSVNNSARRTRLNSLLDPAGTMKLVETQLAAERLARGQLRQRGSSLARSGTSILGSGSTFGSASDSGPSGFSMREAAEAAVAATTLSVPVSDIEIIVPEDETAETDAKLFVIEESSLASSLEASVE